MADFTGAEPSGSKMNRRPWPDALKHRAQECFQVRGERCAVIYWGTLHIDWDDLFGRGAENPKTRFLCFLFATTWELGNLRLIYMSKNLEIVKVT